MSASELVSDGLVTVDQAVGITNLSRSFLYQQMEGGKLPYSKCGKRRMIPRKALNAWMEGNLVGFKQEPAAVAA